MYPLRFQPLFRRYLWGGRRLGTLLGKAIGPEGDYAESWEIVDRGEDQSIVAFGEHRGTALSQLLQSHGEELMGRHHLQSRFPLLFKLLDTNQQLSVQVHPNDEQAAKLTLPDFGKTEAWVILAAEPGSYIYAGVRRGFDRHALAREIARGTCELCLHRFEPAVGDCIFVPAGTVHALGPGLIVAEIQQSSDTTFRLYDWNRLGPDGNPRPLHVEQALEVTDFDRGPVLPQVPQATDRPHVERLVDCEKFVLDRWSLAEPQTIGGDNRCHILSVVWGSVSVESDPAESPLQFGESLLLPAAVGPVKLSPHDGATLLDAYLP